MTPPATTTENSAETRKRIVATAHRHFMAHGFSTVTMDDLARELGMSKKTLYEFFPAKMELLRATMNLKHEGCRAEMEAIAAGEKDFFGRARKTFSYISGLYSLLSPGYLTDLRRNAPEVWAQVQEFRGTFVKGQMLSLIDQGVAQGVLRKDLDREALVRLYLTMTSALLNPELSGWAPGEQISTTFEVFVKVYFEGLITDAGRKNLAGRKP